MASRMSNDVTSLGTSVSVERLKTINRSASSAKPTAAKKPSFEIPSMTHTVKAGDTLTGIAAEYQRFKPAEMEMTAWVQTIQVVNGLGDRDTIVLGQALKIPMLVPEGEAILIGPRPDSDFDPTIDLEFTPAVRIKPNPVTPLPTTLKPLTGTSPTMTLPDIQTVDPHPFAPVEKLDFGHQVVETARDSLGVRYVWGGTNLAKGVDCSGLTQQVFSGAGVDLPRTSREQYTAVETRIKREELQPGDMVFFSRSGRIVHVGIYSGVNDKDQQQYISATNTKGVAEYTIDGWTRSTGQKYAGARRVSQ
jgi:cell wall-associated NlpC family hydrolase